MNIGPATHVTSYPGKAIQLDAKYERTDRLRAGDSQMCMLADVLVETAVSTSSLEGQDRACVILDLDLQRQQTCIKTCNTHLKEQHDG